MKLLHHKTIMKYFCKEPIEICKCWTRDQKCNSTRASLFTIYFKITSENFYQGKSMFWSRSFFCNKIFPAISEIRLY